MADSHSKEAFIAKQRQVASWARQIDTSPLQRLFSQRKAKTRSHGIHYNSPKLPEKARAHFGKVFHAHFSRTQRRANITPQPHNMRSSSVYTTVGPSSIHQYILTVSLLTTYEWQLVLQLTFPTLLARSKSNNPPSPILLDTVLLNLFSWRTRHQLGGIARIAHFTRDEHETYPFATNKRSRNDDRVSPTKFTRSPIRGTN